MRKLFVSCLILIGSITPSFAGDLVFICEKENHFIVKDLVDGRASMTVTTGTSQIELKVRKIASANESRFNLVMLDRKSGNAGQMTIGIFEEVQIGDYSCMVRD